jgi:hypothetical protein
MEGDGSPSNLEERPASPPNADAVAASSSSSSNLESGNISSLDGSASSRESDIFSSTSNSNECSDPDSGGDVEIILSDTNAKKNEADTEEGEIAGGSGTAAVEESGEILAGVTAGREDLLKPGTCFMGRSLMTQSELDALVSEGFFLASDYRLHGKETTPKPQKNESVVFHDFFTVGFWVPVSKRFAEILVAYNVQIHQQTPNSSPQISKFLWACRSFARTNDVDTFVRHFEIHWARKTVTVEDEEKEAQYGCCTFQTC